MNKKLLGALLSAAAVSLFGGEAPKSLVIMLDGARADSFFDTPTPNLDKLMTEDAWQPGYRGAWSFSVDTVPDAPANSAPNHAAIATGVTAVKNLVTDNGKTAGGNYEDWPHVLSYLAPDHRTAFLYGWGESGQVRAKGNVEYLEVGDSAVAAAAVERIGNGVDAMMVYINAPDAAGHNVGFYPHTATYRNTISGCDAIIGEMLSAVAARPEFKNEDWLIIVTSDHGGYHTGHGMPSAHAEKVPVVVAGRHVKSGELAAPCSVVDVPATMLAHFGLDPAKLGLDGRPLGANVSSAECTASAEPPECQKIAGGKTPFDSGLKIKDIPFTLTMMVRADGEQPGDAPVFSNKDWNDGKNPGIVVAAGTSNGWTGPGYVCNVGCVSGAWRLDVGAFDPLPGEWVFMAVSIAADGECRFYEGRPDGSFHFLSGEAENAAPASGLTVHFGQDGTGSYKFTFNGEIRNIEFYPDRALSSRSVYQIYRKYQEGASSASCSSK
ncbi:MAG: alkaline phosphatase family protein [Victivallaceae bacterium]|nr:alkaline phosphatase family protein [Victivallaceae bacterium]